VAELTACPLCRSALPPGAETCPDCGGELAPYRALQTRAAAYVDLARELISRGELAQAQLVADELPLLAEEYADEVAALQARLAIERGELEQAAAGLARLAPGAAAGLRHLLAQRQAAQLRGRELYNSALVQARGGNHALAARLLAQAVEALPGAAELWELKLKADLKSRNFASCYTDLAALDRLGARPREYTHLEQLLPPVSRL
jgi:hypothetical protein